MIVSLCSLALASLLPATGPAPAVPDPALHFQAAQQVPAPSDGFEALQAEYREREKAWIAEIRAAEPQEQRKIFERHPARSFWERYASFAEAGVVAAWQWKVENAGNAGQPVAEVCAEALQKAASSSAVVEAACEGLVGYSALLGEERVLGVLNEALATVPDKRSQGLVAGAIGMVLCDSSDQARRAQGLELLRSLAAEYEGDEIGQRADDEVFRREHLAQGAVAPDFEGQTIDGAPLKLSEHRGKIVVLEFFGFW